MSDCLFEAIGEGWYQPTELTRGPWSPTAQHGGPVAALLAHAIEQSGLTTALAVTRMTVELLRPAPLTPLTVTVDTLRPGRRVVLVEARLSSEEHEVARATALAIRIEPEPLFPRSVVPAPPPRPPAPSRFPWSFPGPLFVDAMDMRVATGSLMEAGAATVWFRLQVPVVDGHAPTPLQRVAAAADFGNGVSTVLDYSRFLYINPDLTFYLYRPPVGEWICLEAATRADPHGTGLAESALYDDAGRVGRSLQSLYVAAR